MFRRSGSDAQAQLDAIGRSQAVIEFNMDGSIITANKAFLDALGYRLEEIKGKHHSMFVPADERDSADYRAFWAALNRGEYRADGHTVLGYRHRGLCSYAGIHRRVIRPLVSIWRVLSTFPLSRPHLEIATALGMEHRRSGSGRD